MKIPENYQAVMPYLIVEKANDFLTFVSDIFDAKILSKHLREDNVTIMHAEVSISGSTIMFAQATEEWKVQNAGLFIYVDNADETYKKAIEKGAETVMELSDQSYGRTCGIKDIAGNTWWVTSHQ